MMQVLNSKGFSHHAEHLVGNWSQWTVINAPPGTDKTETIMSVLPMSDAPPPPPFPQFRQGKDYEQEIPPGPPPPLDTLNSDTQAGASSSSGGAVRSENQEEFMREQWRKNQSYEYRIRQLETEIATLRSWVIHGWRPTTSS